MEFFNLLCEIVASLIIFLFEKLRNGTDWIMWTIENYEVYVNVVKARIF